MPLDWFDVLAHSDSEPTSPFGSQSLFSDTDSDATQPPSESNYELEPMTVLLSCSFCFYSNFKEIEKKCSYYEIFETIVNAKFYISINEF